ncbi:MAG TPA: metal-dependent hydrolase [Pirellulales bacterium]|jgi:hypothetical protein|nr:metal-dependent hydrolase [Pirellulales bacterium]
MAGFKTHITVSTALGIGYGAGAAVLYDVPLPACMLAGGLCSVSGMLPDLDSGPGVPLRESVAFAAAVVPMLMIDRFRQMGLAPESIVLAGGLIYLAIRFGIGRMLRKWTVHRGMFHSVPALAIVGELAYLICAHENPWMRAFNAGAVMIGFSSHLVLDEIWSMEFRHGFHLKSSFGTAIKFWGDCWWANLLTYANVGLLTLMILSDPTINNSPLTDPNADSIATQPSDRGLQ